MPTYHVHAMVEMLYVIEADDPHHAAQIAYEGASGIEKDGKIVKVTEALPVDAADLPSVPDLRDDDRALFDAGRDDNSGSIEILDAHGDPIGRVALPLGGYPTWGTKRDKQVRVTADALAYAVLLRLPTEDEAKRLVAVLSVLPKEWRMSRAELCAKMAAE